MTASVTRQPNRLIHEKSPYLLQHAYNPVDWYPWGAEAFAKAKREDKPILLSIGYSTCYWCHVMEQESFENPAIAAIINASVIPIKVDREERPDLDAIYMSAVQAMTGQGGWPLNVFLTPEGKPFWGGTYFPPEDRWGRAGVSHVVQSIAEAWRTRREELLRSSDTLTQALHATAEAGTDTPLTMAIITTAVQQLTEQFDAQHGGFGPAPKFPRSHTLSFLLRAWYRTRDADTLKMVEHTLDAMARGGLHDHLGGGFHRYSTDDQWLVPHFEKMLYDQALLARTYLEAYQVTGKAQYADVARDIFEYVLRDMRDRAFYSAEDAGEVGKEGEYYVWTPEEINQVLGSDEAAFFNRVYDVTAAGNFEGRNILHMEQRLEDVAKHEQLSLEVVQTRLAASRAALLAHRGQRSRPHRDDKVLTDWNGLMIGALAYGSRVLDDPRYAEAASQAATWLLAHLQDDGRLLHRYRDGQASIPAFLDDYAFFIWGLLELYDATFDVRWLTEAKRLNQQMLESFWDETKGGLWLSGTHNEQLITNTKEFYDGDIPSGNAVAALVLTRLSSITMDRQLSGRAERIFRAYAGSLTQMPHAFPQGLIAFDAWLGPPQELVIAGDPELDTTRQMIRAAHERFLPRMVILLHPPGAAGHPIETISPFVNAQQPIQGRSTAYLCEQYVCRLPVTDLETLIAQLEALR